MSKSKYCCGFILAIAVIPLLFGCGNRETQEEQTRKEKEGQNEEAVLSKIIPWDMGFLAAGAQGTLLEITSEGECRDISVDNDTDLGGIWSSADSVYAAGENGTIYRADSGLSFQKEETGCSENLNVGAAFGDKIYCGGDNGVLLCSEGDGAWERCSVQIQGSVTGLEASGGRCVLVTDKGETAATQDGNTWTVLDYGQYYGEEVSFGGLTYDGGNFWAYGSTDEGTGLFYTASGSVWSRRDINYLEGGSADLTGIEILSLISDGQQLYAWCRGGTLYTFPDCVQCNKETKTEGITSGAAAYNGGKIVIAEDSVHIEILDTDAAKQYLISPETARQKQQEGAVIVDVRSQEEYEKKAVKGSVSIPLEELEERLLQEYPDFGQVLIFYCSKGIRSQSAVERARALGYVEIYSMGSIEGWKYEMQGQED